MNATAYRSPYRAGTDFARELYRRNRVLFAVAAVNLALAVLFTALMQVDSRMLLGRNVWTKPWKFATSIALFTGTMGWLLPSLGLAERIERGVTYVIGGAMMFEIGLISMQAARGVRSHFNDSTPFDQAVFLAMGVTITLSTLTVAYVLYRVVRNPPDLAPAYRRSIQLGILLFLLASLEGAVMNAQDTHSVGVAANSAGLPLVNWKLNGGDLRIAHFVGLHSLQVLPLAGYAVSRWNRVSTRGAFGVVGVVTALYGGLMGGTFFLAMRGHPLVSSVPSVSMATVFSTSFLLVAPFWALMILAPGWSVTDRIVDSSLIAVPAAALYLLLLVPYAGPVASGVFDPSLAGMTTLLATEFGATIAWVHFLAFDLFVGRWIYRDARPRSVPRLVLAPVLLLTLFFGPAGFLAYRILRPAFDGE